MSRERLLELRKELLSLAELGDESAAVVELDQSKVGRLSRMDAMQAQAMAQASAERRDELINPKRLEFDPTVTLCIECASKAEE
jgi:DnaK suppressor protein